MRPVAEIEYKWRRLQELGRTSVIAHHVVSMRYVDVDGEFAALTGLIAALESNEQLLDRARNLIALMPPQPIVPIGTGAHANARRIAPWTDYAGSQICEGDTIRHSENGEAGVVFVLANEPDIGDRWRVLYGDGHVSRLCLQIGEKGQAVVARAGAARTSSAGAAP